MAILLIATLDTKGSEAMFVREILESRGNRVVTLDAGVLGPPVFEAQITRAEVFAESGSDLEEIRSRKDRGEAIAAAARGSAAIATKWFESGRISGVLGLGGSAGTIIATSAMRVLPFGLPKLMVSTLASGDTRPYVGVKDVTMMHSVVDISGINRISRQVLGQAAAAIAAMSQCWEKAKDSQAPDKPMIAATMFGVTTPCVERAREVLEQAGYEVLVFHATGIGGRAMESLIADGLIEGVLDLTTTELADEHVGGILSAGKDRLTVAARVAVPQVVSFGALDMVNFGPPDSVPAEFKDRLFYEHNPAVTLMRTTPEENYAIGKELATKLNRSRAPVAVMMPLRGVSAIDYEGGPFWSAEADSALFDAVRQTSRPPVQVEEFDLHINDEEFAIRAAEKLTSLLGRKTPPG